MTGLEPLKQSTYPCVCMYGVLLRCQPLTALRLSVSPSQGAAGAREPPAEHRRQQRRVVAHHRPAVGRPPRERRHELTGSGGRRPATHPTVIRPSLTQQPTHSLPLPHTYTHIHTHTHTHTFIGAPRRRPGWRLHLRLILSLVRCPAPRGTGGESTKSLFRHRSGRTARTRQIGCCRCLVYATVTLRTFWDRAAHPRWCSGTLL